MDKKALDKLFDDFSKKHLLLVGDLMVDAYIWGKTDRISPEAPVPVLDVVKKEERPGGLANVAINLKELGAKVTVCAVVGNDIAGNHLIAEMEKEEIAVSHVLQVPDRITTVKTRVISNHKHVIRIDEEQTNDLGDTEEHALLDKINWVIENTKIDAIVLEDYNKGVLTENVITGIIQLANAKKIPVCVDPKRKNFFAYQFVSLFKPNLKELHEGLGLDKVPVSVTDLQFADSKLRNVLKHSISLITLSERGVFVSDGTTVEQLPAHIRNIADVSGAGDTVIAVAALCMACNTSMHDMAFLANLAGGIVCEHVGVVPIYKDQLYDEACRLV